MNESKKSPTKPTDNEASLPTLSHILIVMIGPYSLAFEIKNIVGLVSQTSISGKPDGPVRGVIRYQRREIPLASLNDRLGLPPRAAPSRQALIINLAGVWIALEIDAVVEIEDRIERVLEPVPEGLSELGNQFFRGWIQQGDVGAFVPSLEMLFEDADLARIGEYVA